MYAVIKTGGKQYRVSAGEKIKVEQIPADIGQEIILDQVLMVGSGESVKVGAPLVDGAKVTAEILDPEAKGEKLYITRFRRRKHSRRVHGHRQKYVQVKVTAIQG